MKNWNCLLCGVGGQGTVLAAKLIAYAAMKKGMQVRNAETIGMAQRGGSVVSHVRYGAQIETPLIPEHSADVMIAFEPAEAVRCLRYLREDSVIVVSRKAVKPVTAVLSGEDSYTGTEMLNYLTQNFSHVQIVDADGICQACGSPKVLNIALLAAAAKSGGLGITPEEIRQAVTERLPQKFHAINLKAIDIICKGAETL